MGLFWRYFRDTLAWPWLATPGALCVIAKGLADTMDAVRDDIRWMRDQWVVPLAEQDRMQGYGASRGAPRTRHDDDARHRRRVERAFAWHRMGGTVDGLPQILAEYGYPDGRVRNLRDDDPAQWAHFDVELLSPPSTGFGAADIDAVRSLANEYKPARSVLGKVGFTLRSSAGLTAGAVISTAIIMEHRVGGGEAAFPPAPLHVGAGCIQYVIIQSEVA